MVKNTQINNAIREEGKNENDEEIINNVWTFMKKEILEQDLINQQNAEIIYQKYLENNLNKYNNYIPEEYNEVKIKNNDDNEEVWDSFSENSGEDNNEKIDNSKIKQIYGDDLDERNIKILRTGGFVLIGIYLFKIFFSSFNLSTIFGIFWISLIGYLLYKFR